MITDEIREALGDDALLSLMEEAAELSHAAAKLYRVRRGVDPTPVTEAEALDHLIEEVSDVKVAESVCGVHPDWTILYEKSNRWYARLKEAGRIK